MRLPRRFALPRILAKALRFLGFPNMGCPRVPCAQERQILGHLRSRLNTLTGGYTLDVVDSAIVRQNLKVDGNVDLTSSTGDIQVPTTGIDIFRNSGDANYNLRVRDTQGVFEFRNRNFR